MSSEITGLAVSPGVAEGRARVVLDPLAGEPLQPGEILVCETTDPSWTSLFLVASGLVIDIGGALQPRRHPGPGARSAVRHQQPGGHPGAPRTGDLLRVDGDAGRTSKY